MSLTQDLVICIAHAYSMRLLRLFLYQAMMHKPHSCITHGTYGVLTDGPVTCQYIASHSDIYVEEPWSTSHIGLFQCCSCEDMST